MTEKPVRTMHLRVHHVELDRAYVFNSEMFFKLICYNKNGTQINIEATTCIDGLVHFVKQLGKELVSLKKRRERQSEHELRPFNIEEVEE